MNGRNWQTEFRTSVAYGLVIGWLAMSLAPMIAGPARDVVAADFLGLARLSFYVALATTAAAACVPRVANSMGKRPTAFLVAAICCIAGLINWAFACIGHASSVLLACSFASSGIAAIALQFALAGFLNGTGACIRKLVGPAVLGVFVYVVLELIPSAMCQPLYSLIPFASLALMPSSRIDHVRTPVVGCSTSQDAAVAFVMAAAHIFNGMAEFNPFVIPVVMIVGVSLGIIGGAAVIFLVRQTHASRHCITTSCALVIALGVLSQGLLTLTDFGQNLLDHGFGSLFHLVTFIAEYILLALVLTQRPASKMSQHSGGALLCWANIGIACGTMLGMFTHSGASATMVSLFIALVGAFLLGKQAGYDDAPNGCAPVAAGASTDALDGLAKRANLSQRELDVLTLWATGHQVDYVADQLCISKNTAKTHVRHIYTKLGVTSREELIQLMERRE